jgi:hypothetical protein
MESASAEPGIFGALQHPIASSGIIMGLKTVSVCRLSGCSRWSENEGDRGIHSLFLPMMF